MLSHRARRSGVGPQERGVAMIGKNMRRVAPMLVGAMMVWAAPLPGQTPAPAPQVDREQILAAHADEKGGTAEAGRPLYEKQCAGCHRFGAIGKDVGPDLTTLASRFNRKAALEA